MEDYEIARCSNCDRPMHFDDQFCSYACRVAATCVCADECEC